MLKRIVRSWWKVIFGGSFAVTALTVLWHARQAGRRIRLFDDIDRWEHGPRLYAQPDFFYLNTSARPGVQAIRRTLEDWFSRYPKFGRAELRSRIRSDNLNHRSAYFELLIHELLLKLGCKIELHPPVAGTSRRPDFAVSSRSINKFYVEAVLASDQTEAEMAAEARQNQVYDSLNRLSSPNFYIGMDLHGAPTTPPPAKKIRDFLTKHLAAVNPDEMATLFRSGGFRALPHWRYEHDGWKIDFFLIPKSEANRGKAGLQPIGIQFQGARILQTKVAIRNAVLAKAGRYGQLPGPYLIAVNVLSDHVDETDVIEALFGDEKFIYSIGMPPAQGPQIRRAANGAWYGPNPRNTRVSGVIIFDQLSQSNIPWVMPCLYHNPWAAAPYTGPLDHLRRGEVVDNKMEYRGGQPLGALLGLPTGWPGW